LGLGAVTFLPQIQDMRDDKAYEYVEQGKLKRARLLYFYGKLQGSHKAANNFHVVDYRIVRYDDKSSKKKRIANRKKSFRAFDKLTQKGYIPAAYNAGMFYYRSKVGSSDYANGLIYFDHAAASGDAMSGYAADMMRAREHEKEAKYRALRKVADKGNGWAAYRYVKSLRFEKHKLKYAEKYALMAAEAGYPDAQHFLATYFQQRKDRKAWFEKAATAKTNRSLLAATSLAELAEKERDYEAKRRWLTLASTPREKFTYQAVIEPEGLRWRGFQYYISADVNVSKRAAYELALMQIDGVGGLVDKAGAMKNLEYADDWSDAALLLNELKTGVSKRANVKSVQPSKSLVNESLKKIDTQKNMPWYGKLRPLVESKHIRYATRTDLKKYSNGVSKSYSNEKRGYKDWGKVKDCSIAFNCFYLDAPIILPDDMFGAHSATFIISPSVILPKQHVSHNKYIFLSELNVP